MTPVRARNSIQPIRVLASMLLVAALILVQVPSQSVAQTSSNAAAVTVSWADSYQIIQHPLPASGSDPWSITVDSSGLVWFVEQGTNMLGGYDPATGILKQFDIPTPRSEPVSVASDSAGNVWFTELSANLIFQPFEVVLAIAASVLVAATVVVTYHFIRRSERMGGACSASATLSGVGAFLGYTATCPSCLAPTLVSVLFGGIASVQAVYSNLWGVVLPPLVSIGALLLSLFVLERTFGRLRK